MVATDTLVGIVGAVVLVAAMAGVFVYEYNNNPDVGVDDRFAHLSADGDIDSDSIRNADDDDIDGDGIANEDDEDIVSTSTSSGALGPRLEPGAAPSHTSEVSAETGIKGIRVVATVSPTTPDPSGTLSGFELVVTMADGTEIGSGIGSSSIDISSTDILPGNLTVLLQPTQGSFGGGFELTIELIY